MTVLKKGWNKKWSLFQYYFLLYPSILLILHKIDDADQKDDKTLMDFQNGENASIVVLSLLRATAPVILVENKSPFHAIQRSVTICGRSIILSIMTEASVHILSRLMKEILSDMDRSVSFPILVMMLVMIVWGNLVRM